jgi:hypothetical protein
VLVLTVPVTLDYVVEDHARLPNAALASRNRGTIALVLFRSAALTRQVILHSSFVRVDGPLVAPPVKLRARDMIPLRE